MKLKGVSSIGYPILIGCFVKYNAIASLQSYVNLTGAFIIASYCLEAYVILGTKNHFVF